MTFTALELNLLNNTNVLGYIRAKNAERNVQAKAEGWEFWTNMAEDLAERFANVYELELCFARDAYYEWHKDVWGYKRMPAGDMTLEEIWAENASMAQAANEQWEAEQEWLAEQKQMERDQIALGLTDTMSCGEEVELEEWEIYEAMAEEAGY